MDDQDTGTLERARALSLSLSLALAKIQKACNTIVTRIPLPKNFTGAAPAPSLHSRQPRTQRDIRQQGQRASLSYRRPAKQAPQAKRPRRTALLLRSPAPAR